MTLSFEYGQKLADGVEGMGIQYPDALLEILAVDGDGKLQGSTMQIDDGDFSNLTFESVGQCANQLNVEYSSLRNLRTEGIYGSWLYGEKQQLIIYLLEYDITNYLIDAHLKFDIKNPINRGTISFLVIPQFFIEDQRSIINPGAKIALRFQAGDSAWYDMGTFYVDRSNYNDNTKKAKLEARGIIGQPLQDQTFDETHSFSFDEVNDVLEDILILAGYKTTEYSIETTTDKIGLSFDRAKKLYDGVNEILEAQGWKMQELAEGKIVLGSGSFSDFTTPGDYEFEYGKDLYTRQTIDDNRESYTRVCVHTSDYGKLKYEDVAIYESWIIGAQKTKYIEVATGTTQASIDAMATDIADKLSNVGTIETFTGPFRPWLIVGDTAKITKDGEERTVGIITNIAHVLGQQGYRTEFQVDSGGIEGAGKLSDYIQQLQKKKPNSSTRVYT